MTPDRHYLDCNATAPLRPEAKDAMREALEITGNASSVHAEGRRARALIDAARRDIARLAATPPNSVHFTAGGTEANNWALSLAAGPLLFAATSHDSVLRPAANGQAVPVDSSGLIDLKALEMTLSGTSGALVSVPSVNNETGVVQPLEGLAALCRAADALLHADAVQAPGKIDLAAVTELADLVSLSAHKLGGPAGCGALLVRPGLDPEPLLKGGGQEQRRRAGTENLTGIAGFGAAAAAVAVHGAAEQERLTGLRDRMETALLESCPEAVIHGRDALRAPNTTCVRMPGVTAETQVMALDLGGIAVSAGSACSSGKVTPSHVLRAMGETEAAAGEAIRISTGWMTNDADIDALVAVWRDLWARKRAA
ncbi:MAG: cysteine desulfurase family protein [Minwuia sp.]|uniref:cysteine desulfurase family protein n=1 Tax=Minwuia sp. TaxID=2493630 RepID=UPI003A887E16